MGLRLHKGDIDTRSVEDVRSLTVRGSVLVYCLFIIVGNAGDREYLDANAEVVRTCTEPRP